MRDVEVLFAYLHYLAIIATAGFLTVELILCRAASTAGPGIDQIRLLARVDVAYFTAALAALATGAVRLFFYAKGVGFYLPNPFFHAKIGLYVLIAVMSIAPTMRFIRWNRAVARGGAPPSRDEMRRVWRIVHVELMLLALIPLMAVLMARGIGR